jgi:hypothetical protein
MEGDAEAPPAAQPQVIYIVQPAVQKRSLKEDYATKAATVLGSLHLLCGLITLAASIVGILHGNISPTVIWVSIFFFVSGGLTIGGGCSGSRCLVVATLVMSIISAVSAGILIILASILMHAYSWRTRGHWNSDVGTAMYALEIVMGLTMLVVGITTAALTCRPLCCRQAGGGAVHYTPGATSLPASLPAGLVLEQEDPPSYSDVADSGSKYQKF